MTRINLSKLETLFEFQYMIFIYYKHCNFLKIENNDMHLRCENIQIFRAFVK